MKTYFSKLAGLFLAFLTVQILVAQSINWTLPPFEYQPGLAYTNLPQPSGDLVYEGDPANFVHASYSTPDGEMKLFTVDEFVYDKNGYEIGQLQYNNYVVKKGFNERLILPMGDDCRRYAIIYRSAVNGTGGAAGQLATQTIFMATYNMDAENDWNEDDPVIGALDYEGDFRTLTDIGRRDGLLYYQPGLGLYSFIEGTPNPERYENSNICIAASDLIDGCYYRVYIFDGVNLIKYHLTDTDLEWQGVLATVPNTSISVTTRSEMELIKLSNGNYRIAIPTKGDTPGGFTGEGITLYDLNGSTGDIISGTYKYLDYSGTPDAAVYGMEFDASGQYLYITNSTNSTHTDLLEVYDVAGSSYVTTTMSMTNLAPFQQSFIERYGNDLYLASTTYLGKITNSSSPGSAQFLNTFQALSGTYGSDAGNSFFQRQLLPEQLDMNYPDPVTDMSCACCKDNIAEFESFTATTSETWTATSGGNPFGSNGNVYIRDELRIPAGVTLTISSMNFYFGNEAKVIIEKGDGILNGGHLIMDNTLFTSDTRCNDRLYEDCQEGGACNDKFWKGVRVIGDDSEDQTTSAGIQGRLTMKSNSEIEFALTGVMAGNEGCVDCGGGILDIADSKFKDNLTGVSFQPYVRTLNGNETYNRSYVRTTNFTRTSALPNDTRLTHIYADGCSTIRLRGNIYQNEAWAGYTQALRGVGIYAYNSSIDESWYCNGTSIPCPDRIQSQFKNLHKGIDATSTSSTRTLSEGYAIFTNNYIGIQASNLQRPIILDNEFYVINETNASGLKLIQCDQYVVENNFFTAMATSPVVWMFGITVQSSGPYVNELYRNRFEDITIGIVSSGVNADCVNTLYRDGLRWKCNRFDQTIPYADIFVYNGNVSDEQGECDASLKPARNIFSHTNGFDIRVRDTGSNLTECISGGTTAFFNIYYNYNEIPALPTPIQTRLEPLYYSNIRVSPVECSTSQGTYLPGSNDCPVQKTSLDDLNDVLNIAKSGGEGEITMESLTEEAISLYSMQEESYDQGLFAQAEYDFWSKLTEAYQWDTLGNFTAEGIYNLMNEYQPQSTGAKFAKMLSQQIGVETPEWISSDYLVSEAVQNLPVADDSGTLPNLLFEVTDSGDLDSYSYVLALNELYAEHQRTYDTWIPEPADLELPEAFEAEDSKSMSQANGSVASVKPNPFTDSFNLSIKVEEDFNNLKITIYDVLGRQLSSQNYREANQVEIDGSKFPSGVLIYSVYLDGKLFDTGRIVKSE